MTDDATIPAAGKDRAAAPTGPDESAGAPDPDLSTVFPTSDAPAEHDTADPSAMFPGLNTSSLNTSGLSTSGLASDAEPTAVLSGSDATVAFPNSDTPTAYDGSLYLGSLYTSSARSSGATGSDSSGTYPGSEAYPGSDAGSSGVASGLGESGRYPGSDAPDSGGVSGGHAGFDAGFDSDLGASGGSGGTGGSGETGDGPAGPGGSGAGPGDDDSRRRRRLLTIGITVVVVLVLVFCGGLGTFAAVIGHLASVGDERRAVRTRTDAACLELERRLNRLAPPGTATAPAQRAAAIRAENLAVGPFLSELDQLLDRYDDATGDDSGQRDWADGWRRLIDARETYADALDRQGNRGEPAFFLAPQDKDGRPVIDRLQRGPQSCAGVERRLATPDL